jgi:hypothetical protein
MNISKPLLALIGHGTTGKDKTGKDDIEPGIHLRWAFRREMGFPLGCSRLYRRQSGEYGTLVCLDFQKVRESEKRKPFVLGPRKKPFKITSSHWPLALESRPVDGRTRPRLERVLLLPEAHLTVSLPERAYRVTVHAKFDGRGSLTVVAYADGVEVGRSSTQGRSGATRSVTVQASAIDRAVLYARSIALVQVCYVPCERCEDHEAGGWELLEDSICLPICYPDGPCKEPYDEPDCEWLNVVARLPKDRCVRERYGGERAKELVSVLRTLVDPGGMTAQADRLVEATAVPEDCPPPGQEQPTIRFPAIDAILIAAIDPIVARVVGLYYLDTDAEEGKDYDYKIEGDWPPGTLWQLSNYLTFDEFPLRHRYLLNVFTAGELTFRAAIRPTILDRPSTTAGTSQALAFLETDGFDWNLPDLENLPFSVADHTVEIRFPQPVGEVQIHLGQQTPNVRLEAWDDERGRRVDVLSGQVLSIGAVASRSISADVYIEGLDHVLPNLFKGKVLVQRGSQYGDITLRILSSTEGSPMDAGQKVSLVLLRPFALAADALSVGPCSIEPGRSTRREDVLAVHGYQSTDQITRMVLKGKDFWLYKVCWQVERIPHGTHCAFAYGLRIEDAEPLKPPNNVQAFRLPGLVEKVADCRPLMEGATLDARYSIGVSWDLPLMNKQLLPKRAVRYHVRRNQEDGLSIVLTEDDPVMVTKTPPEIQEARLQNLPDGWPEDPLHLIDSGLEPGKYQYQVAGIDLFGRVSAYSDHSRIVEPKPPPPPPPANVSAYFIDSRDPWLSDQDIAALPEDVQEAIRVRWRWPQEYDRMSPDVQEFHIYYVSGTPNVVHGQVKEVGNESNGRMQVTAEIAGLDAAPEDLLAGRLLFQGGKAFRILSHGEGVSNESGHEIAFDVCLPPKPSENRPAKDPCSIALDASIPVQVMALEARDAGFKGIVETTALGAIPSSGLEDGILTIPGVEASLESVSPDTVEPDHVEMTVTLTLPDPAQRDRLLEAKAPFFAKLKLPAPNTDVYKDYGTSNTWPEKFDPVPKTVVGGYDLVIRTAADGESTGLIAMGPGKYVLVVEQLPPDLDVDSGDPIREGHFGVSCQGPGGEGPVCVPARIVRVYRGAIGDQAALQSLNQEPAPVENIYATPPNFEGKSTYTFTWKKQRGWHYEVYRSLDDTIFRTDAEVRSEKNPDGTPKRSRDPADYAQWLGFFDAEYHEDVKPLVIEPAIVDRQAIEGPPHRNVLLQALASLPFNDRAFTRLDLDQEHLKEEEDNSGLMRCVDDRLDGRAEGRYFYRVQAFDSAGNPSPMGTSTPPVYVRGDLRPVPPVITRVEGGDRQIVIHWAAVRDPRIKGYVLYRTDDPAKTVDWRRMDPILPEGETEYSYRVPDMLPESPPAEHSYTDEPVEPKVPYYYGLLAIREEESGTRHISELLAIRAGQAVDTQIPAPPVWQEATWILIRQADGVEEPWPADGVIPDGWIPAIRLAWTSDMTGCTFVLTRQARGQRGWEPVAAEGDYEPMSPTEARYVDQNVLPERNYSYRIVVMSPTGMTSVEFREIQVARPPTS